MDPMILTAIGHGNGAWLCPARGVSLSVFVSRESEYGRLCFEAPNIAGAQTYHNTAECC